MTMIMMVMMMMIMMMIIMTHQLVLDQQTGCDGLTAGDLRQGVTQREEHAPHLEPGIVRGSLDYL